MESEALLTWKILCLRPWKCVRVSAGADYAAVVGRAKTIDLMQ